MENEAKKKLVIQPITDPAEIERLGKLGPIRRKKFALQIGKDEAGNPVRKWVVMKAMLSQPMAGKTDEEIVATREKAIKARL